MDEEMEKLELMYQALYTATMEQKKKRLPHNSVLAAFLSTKAPDVFELQKASAFTATKLPHHIKERLLTRQFIRENENGSYVLTAFGIWAIERVKNGGENFLIQALDEKLFNVYDETPKVLSDRYKVILLSLIAGRAFSTESAVDLKQDELMLDAWKNVMLDSATFLHSIRCVKSTMTEEDIFGPKGNEHEIRNFLRHSDKLKPQTKQLYQTTKVKTESKYYLDLYDGKELSKDKLRELMRMILGPERLAMQEIDRIVEFCNRVAHEQSVYLYKDLKTHIFGRSHYDIVMRDAFLTL